MTTRKILGSRGETAAADYLKRQGYEIIAANWRCPVGEFDLIARQGETLVFVEVRTRQGGIEAAMESITPRKRAILERLAYLYMDENALESDWRIDVIAVTHAGGKPVVEHAENALDW